MLLLSCHSPITFINSLMRCRVQQKKNCVAAALTPAHTVKDQNRKQEEGTTVCLFIPIQLFFVVVVGQLLIVLLSDVVFQLTNI